MRCEECQRYEEILAVLKAKNAALEASIELLREQLKTKVDSIDLDRSKYYKYAKPGDI